MSLKKYRYNGQTWYKGECGVCLTEFHYKHGNKPLHCANPKCASNTEHYPEGLWMKPTTEILLFRYQDVYLSRIDKEAFSLYAEEIKKPMEDQDGDIILNHTKNIDKPTLEKMCVLMESYSGSLLKKKLKTKGFFLSPESFEENLKQIVYLWLESFMKKPGFRVEDSWAGFIERKTREALYKYKHDEMNDSLDSHMESYGDSPTKKNTLMDLQESFHIESVFGNSTYDPYATGYNILDEIKKILWSVVYRIRTANTNDSVLISYMTLLSFLFFLKDQNKNMYFIYDSYGNQIKDNQEKLKMVLRRYLRSVHSN